MRSRVKICGITRQQDALAVVENGADALGLVFYPDSPRYIEPLQAQKITRILPPFVTITGLFVNAAPDTIEATMAVVPLGLLQFHGGESNADCVVFGLPFIKSIAVKDGTDLLAEMEAYPDAAGFLLDTWQPQTHGGGGEVFDWNNVPASAGRSLILAGGLTPENVATAIQTVNPYAVDVSSGVESAPGIKSEEKIVAFMQGVRKGGTDTQG